MATSWSSHSLLTAHSVYPHLNRVFLTVVNKGNSLVVLLNAIGRPHSSHRCWLLVNAEITA